MTQVRQLGSPTVVLVCLLTALGLLLAGLILLRPRELLYPVFAVSASFFAILLCRARSMQVCFVIASWCVLLVWYVSYPLSFPEFYGAGDIFFHQGKAQHLLELGLVPPDPRHGYDSFPSFHIFTAVLSLVTDLQAKVAMQILSTTFIAVAAATAGLAVVALLQRLTRLNRTYELQLLAITILLVSRPFAYHAFYSTPRILAVALFSIVALSLANRPRRQGRWTVIAILCGAAMILSHPVVPLQQALVWSPLFVLLSGPFILHSLALITIGAVASPLYAAQNHIVGSVGLLRYELGHEAASAPTVRFELSLTELILRNIDFAIVLLLLIAGAAHLLARPSARAKIVALLSLGAFSLYAPTPLAESPLASGIQIWRWSLVLIVPVMIGVLSGVVWSLGRRGSSARNVILALVLSLLTFGSYYNPLVDGESTWTGTPRSFFTASEIEALTFAAANVDRLTADYASERWLVEKGVDVQGRLEKTCSAGAVLLRAESGLVGIETTKTTPPSYLQFTLEESTQMRQTSAVVYDVRSAFVAVCREYPP